MFIKIVLTILLITDNWSDNTLTLVLESMSVNTNILGTTPFFKSSHKLLKHENKKRQCKSSILKWNIKIREKQSLTFLFLDKRCLLARGGTLSWTHLVCQHKMNLFTYLTHFRHYCCGGGIYIREAHYKMVTLHMSCSETWNTGCFLKRTAARHVSVCRCQRRI